MPVAHFAFTDDDGTRRYWDLAGDGSGTFRRYVGDQLAEERPFTQAETDVATLVAGVTGSGELDDLSRVRTALTVDRTYLDKVQAGTATQADHIAQLAPLTRQVAALLVRVVLRGA